MSTLSGDDANGISNVNCHIAATEVNDIEQVRNDDDLLFQIQSTLPEIMEPFPTDCQSPTQTSNTTAASILFVLFIEFDTSGTLALIKVDPRYLAYANLMEGMRITYPSILQSLNPSLGLEEQLQYVPGGVGLFIFGSNNKGEVILSSRLVWEFNRACNVTVEIKGKTLGWIDFVSVAVYVGGCPPVAVCAADEQILHYYHPQYLLICRRRPCQLSANSVPSPCHRLPLPLLQRAQQHQLLPQIQWSP